MDILVVLWVLSIAAIVLAGIGFGRMAWRILNGQEEFEPGGSFGRQAVGRYHEHRGPERRRRLARFVRR